ncbi:hypothetical protein L6164_025273 [Bauhinia variegata]|uniref:Uncharacterized protein n=1 Tax=Bauhinia variegata TaxID=167791 RepID=A0ACB9M1P5_BAUVA|nr:hypothetical protein L6164_025273 [Bauhinia variegata]
MNFGKSKDTKFFSLPKQPQLDFQKALGDLQCRCSTLARNLSNLPFLELKPPSFKTHFLNAISNLQNHAKQSLDAGMTNFYLNSSSGKIPAWARIAETDKAVRPLVRALSIEEIEERLAGVPVYALSNATEEFVLVSGASTGKSLGLFCFKKEDAEVLLEHVKGIDREMRSGSKVVPVALNKVFQLKMDGVAFRLIPEYSQVMNALRERESSGFSSKGFSGVPVFQSRSLVLKSQDKRYRPLFFRKEDLENSLRRASHEQNVLNPALKPGDIQVAVLEDIIKGMKEGSKSTWDDVVFIPPGFDVTTVPIEG